MENLTSKSQRIDQYFDIYKNKSEEYLKIIESKFQFLEDELELRIESIRLSLENVAAGLNKTIDDIKKKRKNELRNIQTCFDDSAIKSALIDQTPNLNSLEHKAKARISKYNRNIMKLMEPISLNRINNVELDHVGLLQNPFYYYKDLKSVESIHLPSYMTCDIVYNSQTNSIYLLERIMKSVQIVDVNCSFIETIYLKDRLNLPSAISLNEYTGDLFILDKGARKIIIIDSSKEFKADILVNMDSPKTFVFDKKTSNFYIVNRKLNGQLMLVDMDHQTTKKSMNIEMANHLCLDENQLYISTRNCILIVDKLSLKLSRTLEFPYNINLFSVYNSLYILTVKESKSNGDYENSLNVYNLHNAFLKEIKLNLKVEIFGFLSLNKQIVLSSGSSIPSIHSIKFY